MNVISKQVKRAKDIADRDARLLCGVFWRLDYIDCKKRLDTQKVLSVFLFWSYSLVGLKR